MVKKTAGGKTADVTVSRSAKTGKFVTEKYANAHKGTTVTEHRKKSAPPKKK